MAEKSLWGTHNGSGADMIEMPACIRRTTTAMDGCSNVFVTYRIQTCTQRLSSFEPTTEIWAPGF